MQLSVYGVVDSSLHYDDVCRTGSRRYTATPARHADQMARWQSGYAAACKAADIGSIPFLASMTSFSDISGELLFVFLIELVVVRDRVIDIFLNPRGSQRFPHPLMLCPVASG